MLRPIMLFINGKLIIQNVENGIHICHKCWRKTTNTLMIIWYNNDSRLLLIHCDRMRTLHWCRIDIPRMFYMFYDIMIVADVPVPNMHQATSSHFSIEWIMIRNKHIALLQLHKLDSKEARRRASNWFLFELVGLPYHIPNLSLQWRHNGRDSFSNHQPRECLICRLIRRRP